MTLPPQSIAAGELPWPLLLDYLQPRCVPALEAVDGRAYRRQLACGALVLTRPQPRGPLRLALPPGCDAATGADARQRVRRLFALGEDWTAARRQLRRDPLLAPRIAGTPGLRPLGCWDPFELCLRTVLGQQVTVAAAATLMRRLVQRCGGAPTPAAVAAADLGAIGMPARRVAALQHLARAVDGGLALDAPWPQLDAALAALPGFGPWTRSYLAIRLGREPDAFPAGDVGLQRAAGAPGAKALLQRAEAWRPYRALAAIYLWAG